MVGQHQSVAVDADADQLGAEGRPLGQVADCRAVGRTQPIYLLLRFVLTERAKIGVLPSYFGISRDDLYRLAKSPAEVGHQIRVTAEHQRESRPRRRSASRAPMTPIFSCPA